MSDIYNNEDFQGVSSTGTMPEIRTTSATGGQKGVKLARFDLIPIDALTQLAEHYGRGAEKYDDNQWRKGYEFSKSYAALQRHLTAWWAGEDNDPELGSSHLAAAAWHVFTLMTFAKEFPEYDDRYRAAPKPDKTTNPLDPGGWFFPPDVFSVRSDGVISIPDTYVMNNIFVLDEGDKL